MVRLAPSAVADLDHVYAEGLERFGSAQADAYLDGFGTVFATLSDHPMMGRLRDDVRPPVRTHPHGVHIVVYEVIDFTVLILRVRHAREDWISDPLG